MSTPIRLLLRASLFIFLTTGIVGLYLLSIQQESYALRCAKIGGFASLVYTVLTIRNVLTAPRLSASAKLVWIVALVLFQVFAGVWYYLSGRNASRQHTLHT